MLKKRFIILIITFILILNFFLGFQRLSTFSAVDEPYWTYDRTPKFWKAIQEQRWKNTKVNDKPGVTVAWLSGLGLPQVDPLAYKSLRGDPKTPAELNEVHRINFWLRLPIFLFILTALPFFYFLLKKLFDEKIALLSFIFIGLSPILLGISLIINPDSLIWIFGSFAFLTFLIYQKNSERKYLYLAGLFVGLSLLTKYVANILYVFFFFLPFLEYIFAEKKPELTIHLKKMFQDFLILAAVSMATFFLLFPATWVNPKILLQGTFLSQAFESTWPLFVGLIAFIAADLFWLKSRLMRWLLDSISRYQTILVRFFVGGFLLSVVFVFLNTYLDMRFFDFIDVLASPKGEDAGLFIFGGKIMADIYSLLFGVSSLILVAALFFLGLIFKEKSYSSEMKIAFYFLLFILLYYLASTVNSVVATVRYQIILYPLFLIIAAMGIKKILELKFFQNIPVVLTYAVIAIILAFSLFQIKPFYLTYASALLPEKYLLNLKDMGDGSFEAAEYLNQKTTATELNIWSDKGAVCESFIGNCNIGFTKKDLGDKNFDYFVVSAGRKSRSLKMSRGINDIDFAGFYNGAYAGEYELHFDNRPENYVKVIKNPNK